MRYFLSLMTGPYTFRDKVRFLRRYPRYIRWLLKGGANYRYTWTANGMTRERVR